VQGIHHVLELPHAPGIDQHAIGEQNVITKQLGQIGIRKMTKQQQKMRAFWGRPEPGR